MAAQFTTDLNPKSTGKMDLADLVKMNEYMGKTAKSKPTTTTPGADAVLAQGNIKSSIDDVGVPFKFGNNYQKE